MLQYQKSGKHETKKEDAMKIRQLCSQAIVFIIVLGVIIGNPVCAEAAGGDVVWETLVNGSPASSPTIESSPTIFNQRIYFGVKNANLYCIDARNGKKI